MGRTLTAILGLVCSLLVSACSGDSVAGPSDPTPTTSTTSMSSSPTSPPTSSAPTSSATQEPQPQPPKMPPLAKEKSPAGAKAFVQYYIEVLNDAWSTKSSKLIRQNATDRCKVCLRLAGLVDSVAKNGGYQHGGRWTPLSSFSVPTQPESKPILITKIRIARGSWLESSGSTPQPIEARTVTYDFYLEWQASRWQLTDITP